MANREKVDMVGRVWKRMQALHEQKVEPHVYLDELDGFCIVSGGEILQNIRNKASDLYFSDIEKEEYFEKLENVFVKEIAKLLLEDAWKILKKQIRLRQYKVEHLMLDTISKIVG